MYMGPRTLMYVGRRRLIWAHILAQEGLYEPQKAYVCPRRLMYMGTRRLMYIYGPTYGAQKA